MKNLSISLALCAAIALGGVFLSGQLLDSVRESAIYRKSKIVGSIFSGEDVGVSAVLTDARARTTLLKFTGALADAYVRFELIPVGELETFSAVYRNLTTDVEIDAFEYRRRNLILTGVARDESAYRSFLQGLRGSDQFAKVIGVVNTDSDGVICFEIECLPAHAAQFMAAPA